MPKTSAATNSRRFERERGRWLAQDPAGEKVAVLMIRGAYSRAPSRRASEIYRGDFLHVML
jgi:hypothetical protein